MTNFHFWVHDRTAVYRNRRHKDQQPYKEVLVYRLVGVDYCLLWLTQSTFQWDLPDFAPTPTLPSYVWMHLGPVYAHHGLCCVMYIWLCVVFT